MEPLTKNYAIKLIPKKKCLWVLDYPGLDQAYGLEAVSEISIVHLYFYYALMVAGTVTYWAW